MADSSPIKFPFQDAFEQFWISPQTSWDRFFNPQLIISLNSQDADVENHVLKKAGSYGRQLGRIIDVLDVLVGRLRDTDLTPAERLAVDRFRELSRHVDAAVEERRGTRDRDITTSDVDRVAEQLQVLARSDEAAWKRLSDRLRSALAPDEPPATGAGRAPEPRTASRPTRGRA
jgi:hypothetical protein